MSAALRLCAVSVDLDEVDCYAAIHGIASLAPGAAHAVYRRALPRLLELFEELAIPVTLFAIGRDLSDDIAAEIVRRAAESGHEIGNHSLDHFYDLSRRDAAEIRAQIAGGSRAIEQVTGRAPVGFRAPGYTINDRMFDVLRELGVAYDSSVLPCPAYYAAKVLAIAQYRLRGRPTHSVIDTPRVLASPAEPYRVGRPFSTRGNGLLELPIGVTRDHFGRLPFIGTSLVLAGQLGAGWLTRAIAGRSLVNLELHGIDAADADEDGLRALAGAQPDLRLSAATKLATLRSVLLRLRELEYRFVTLADAARAFG